MHHFGYPRRADHSWALSLLLAFLVFVPFAACSACVSCAALAPAAPSAPSAPSVSPSPDVQEEDGDDAVEPDDVEPPSEPVTT